MLRCKRASPSSKSRDANSKERCRARWCCDRLVRGMHTLRGMLWCIGSSLSLSSSELDPLTCTSCIFEVSGSGGALQEGDNAKPSCSIEHFGEIVCRLLFASLLLLSLLPLSSTSEPVSSSLESPLSDNRREHCLTGIDGKANVRHAIHFKLVLDGATFASQFLVDRL